MNDNTKNNAKRKKTNIILALIIFVIKAMLNPLEKSKNKLTEKIEEREFTFDEKSGKWQEGEKGEQFQEKTNELQEGLDNIDMTIKSLNTFLKL